MEIATDKLEKIKELSGLFFTPKEIAIIMQFDVKPFCATIRREEGKIYEAFMGGRLGEELLVRKSIIDFAKKGSPSAQTMALELLKDSAAKIIDR